MPDFAASLALLPEELAGMKNGSLVGLRSLLSGRANCADKRPVYSTYFREYGVDNFGLAGRAISAQLQLQRC